MRLPMLPRFSQAKAWHNDHVNVNVMDHQVAHVHLEHSPSRSWFEGCCGCGWIGRPQAALAAAVDDVLLHCRPYIPHVCVGACLCITMSRGF